MAFSPMAGVNGAVKISTTSYSFAKWKFDMKVGLPKVTNFTGSGARQIVAGILEGTVSLSGPYDEGNMAFTVGTSYALILSWNGSITLTVTALLESIGASQDVEDAGRVEMVFQSNGSFTAAVV